MSELRDDPDDQRHGDDQDPHDSHLDPPLRRTAPWGDGPVRAPSGCYVTAAHLSERPFVPSRATCRPGSRCRRALPDAVKRGYLQTNVAACANLPGTSAEHRELPDWFEEQLLAFLDSVVQQRLYPPWRLLAITGCPKGRGHGVDLA